MQRAGWNLLSCNCLYRKDLTDSLCRDKIIESVYMNGKIELKSIEEYLEDKKDLSFVVPNYQRGYKWRAKDVEYLIDDIAEIEEDDTSDYCLQPIVVAKGESGNELILVDGQQRLTTIWLILNWASHNGLCKDNRIKFDIRYDTRDDSNDYLDDIKVSGEYKHGKNTCDTYYFSEALKVIENRKGKLEKFFKNLSKNVKVIWYEIDPEEGPAHFERLNSAKISLTNAELVKAYLFTNANDDVKQRMACEWDEMEYKLQNDDFFSFITTKNSIYNKDYNRIELLLDLYAKTTQEDREKDEFHTFNEIVKRKKLICEKWQEIQDIFNRLLSWYNDIFLFNMIGYLIENNGDIELSEIWKECDGKPINTFKEFIRKRVLNNMPSKEEIKSLVYKDSRTKNTLLLFNILSLMSVTVNAEQNEYKYQFNDKFHFDLYKKENWDKEHVHATASQPPQKKSEWILWLRNLSSDKEVNEKIIELTNNSNSDNNFLPKEYKEWIEKAAKIEDIELDGIDKDNHPDFKKLKKENFEPMYEDIIHAIEGNDEDAEPKQNSIGNLVLLNASINRSGAYKVAPFSVKRRIIMEKIKSGSFVPLGTQNVFMKVYTPTPGNFYKWEKEACYDGNGKSDRDYYIDAIISTFDKLRG